MHTNQLAALTLGLAFLLSCWGSCAAGEILVQLKAEHRQQYSRATFSPDGRFVAAVGPGGRAGRLTEGQLTIWELGTRKTVARIATFPMDCGSVKFSPDGKTLAVGCGDGTVHLYGFSPGEEKLLTPKGTLPGLRPGLRNTDRWPDEITFSPSGQLFARTNKELLRPLRNVGDKGIQCLMTNGKSPPVTFKPLSKADSHSYVDQLHFLSEEQMLATIHSGTSPPKKIFVLNPAEGTVESEIDLDEKWFAYVDIAVARDVPRFVVGGDFLRVYDSETKKGLADFPVAPPGPFTSATFRHVAISPDGRRVATTCINKLQIWDVDNEKLAGSLTSPLRGLSFAHSKLEFSPDGSLLVCATGSSESTLPIFRVDQIIDDKPAPVIDPR